MIHLAKQQGDSNECSNATHAAFYRSLGASIEKFLHRLTNVDLYKDMVLTRTYDNKAVALQRTGKLGTYPSHLGAELVLGHALHPRDVFVPYYRDMPAMWVRGIPMEKNLQYWGGDERGSDFNVMPADGGQPEHCNDLLFCVPIATQCTHAVGVASALKIDNHHHAALVTCGDGATSTDFLESINRAGAWNLPLVFVINNNQWAISVGALFNPRLNSYQTKPKVQE